MYGYGVPGVPLISGGQSGIPHVPMDQPKNLFRYGEQTIWSTQMHQGAAGGFTLANGTFRVFTTPLGQQGQGFASPMSIAETNLKEGGRVPSGVAYDVFGVSCHVMQASAVGDPAGGASNAGLATPMNGGVVAGVNTGTQKLVNIVNNLVLSWDFTQTQVDIAPATLIGAGGGIFGCIAVGDDADQRRGAENNGNGSLWLYRKHPVALPGNSTFAVILRYGARAATLAAADTSIAIKIALLGYYKNVIEIG